MSTFDKSISDVVFQLINQNEPLCVRAIFFELIWTFSKQIWNIFLDLEQG